MSSTVSGLVAAAGLILASVGWAVIIGLVGRGLFDWIVSLRKREPYTGDPVLMQLCVYDPRHPYPADPEPSEDSEEDGWRVPGAPDCCCDNCLAGRHVLAAEILQLREALAKLTGSSSPYSSRLSPALANAACRVVIVAPPTGSAKQA